MKRFFIFLKRMTITLVVFFLIGCTLLYFGQDRLLFFPRAYGKDAAALFERYEKLPFDIAGAGKQYAYYQGPGDVLPQKLWIVTGGNGALALGWDFVVAPALKQNSDHGYLLIEYPGYGENEGKPSRREIQNTIEGAAVALATHLGVEVETLKARSSFLGHSLGAAVALECAANWGRGEVIALAPFTSVKAMANRMVGPLSFLSRHRWDNEASLIAIAGIDGARVMICHGANDEIVPVSMGRALKEEFPDIVTYFEYPNLSHNNIGYELREQLAKQLAR